MIVGLKINSIKFKFPEGKLKMFFSWEDDKFRKSTMIKSRILVPKEAVEKYGEIGFACFRQLFINKSRIMILNDRIKKELMDKSGVQLEKAKDFELLADIIFQTTKRSIGVTTLKRLFGTINDSRKTNEFTLNTIAIYLGYCSWNDYIATNSVDSIWNFPVDNTVFINELKENTTITINYLNREVTFIVQVLDNTKVLVVKSAKNSSLACGDVLFVHKIRKGERLEADKIIRGNNIGNFKTNSEIVSISIN